MESSTCKTDTIRCAKVSLTYPMATQGSAEAMKAVNDSIMSYLVQSVGIFEESPDAAPNDLEKAAAGFIGGYETFLKDGPEYVTPWVIDTDGKVLYQSPKYVSIEISTYSYAGGAHPNGYSMLLNFDAATGAKLEPIQMVSDTTRLKQLAEAKFREARELAPTADWNEEGFFWGEGFFFPANIAITDKGLYFVYNAYEAAAYVLGPTDFTITYEELKGIWKE
ncbi:MAG: DUF3298 and DUF4163 domain-containing protein [Saprospiraceae bacterium]|nr:DUF3298 and DUF4163 domain-containing protein [Saprospiraceae bacterium]